MNKYKVGDKFITEIIAIEPYMLKLKNGGDWIAYEDFLDQLQPMEAEAAMTAEEAWETAKQILFKEELSTSMLEEIFGTRNHFAIMRDFTPQEAKAKIEAWKKQKEEVKVGDVLKDFIGQFCIVTSVHDNLHQVSLLWKSGVVSTRSKDEIRESYEKTGEHIDLDAIFEQLGGKKND